MFEVPEDVMAFANGSRSVTSIFVTIKLHIAWIKQFTFVNPPQLVTRATKYFTESSINSAFEAKAYVVIALRDSGTRDRNQEQKENW